MKANQFLYEGKAKRIYTTEDPDIVRVEYKDTATAFNNQKQATLQGKGQLNTKISAFFFQLLQEKGIANHFVKQLSPIEQLVKRVTILPIEVVVRNRVAGTMAKRLGLEEGRHLPRPIVDFYYKQDELNDPLITDDHILVLNLATESQLTQMREIALQVNRILGQFMLEKGIILVDFKLEFGIDAKGQLLLADEISPDTCRFWDVETEKKLDKDRFRRDLGDVLQAYEEIWSRIGGEQDV